MTGRDRGDDRLPQGRDGAVYCTFQVRGRGGENLIGAYSYLDLTPLAATKTGRRTP